VGANLATKKDKPWHAQSLINTICGTAAIEAQKMLKQKKSFYNFDQAL
jgi:predicted ATPase